MAKQNSRWKSGCLQRSTTSNGDNVATVTIHRSMSLTKGAFDRESRSSAVNGKIIKLCENCF